MNDTSETIFAWVALASFTIEALMGKYLLKRYQIATLAFNFARNSFGAIFAAILLLTRLPDGNLPYSESLIVAGICYAASNLLYIVAVSRLDISIFGALFNLRLVFSVIFAAVFAGEVPSPIKFALIFVICLTGITANYTDRGTHFPLLSKGFLAAIGTMIALASMAVAIKLSGHGGTPEIVGCYLLLIAFLTSCVTLPRCSREALTLIKNRKACVDLAIMSTAGCLGTIFATYGYAANVGITSAIISIPITSGLSILLSLKVTSLFEQNSVKVYLVRGISALLAGIAGILLSVT